MAHETVYCYHCEQAILNGDYIVVSVGDDHVFFHTKCYQQWQEEQKAERHRQKELWEYFG
jgi:hypothetical protein